MILFNGKGIQAVKENWVHCNRDLTSRVFQNIRGIGFGIKVVSSEN
jgi:hypothetical protein